MSSGQTDPRRQMQGQWRIKSIGDMELPATLTLEFDGTDVSAFAGCNTISAHAYFGLNDFQFETIVSTKKSCNDETMAREMALIEAMSATDLLAVEPSGNAIFFDLSNQFLFSVVRP